MGTAMAPTGRAVQASPPVGQCHPRRRRRRPVRRRTVDSVSFGLTRQSASDPGGFRAIDVSAGRNSNSLLLSAPVAAR
jgi:hypothetical protein